MRSRAELLAHLRAIEYATSETVVLADLELRVHASRPGFAALDYFSRSARPDGPAEGVAAQHSFYWIDPDDLPRGVLEAAGALADEGFRSERFRSGFYLTHHHGKPALLFTEPDETYVIGGDPTKILWSYLVKVVLSAHAWRTSRLHLKAAAIVVDGRTLLVVGRGGGGKTFLTLLAGEAGATVLANTHVLVSPSATAGVASSVRIRPHPAYARLLAASSARPHFEGEELIVDPAEVLPAVAPVAGPPEMLLVAQYRADAEPEVAPVAERDALLFLDQFARPINTYGMKYDVWDFTGGELGAFARCLADEQRMLAELVRGAPAVSVSWPMRDADDARALLARVLQAAPVGERA